MASESIHILYKEMKIATINATPITPMDIDTFMSTYPSWEIGYDEDCRPFLFTGGAAGTQTISIINPTGGANMEFKSQPFVGGRPDRRPW